MPSVLNAAARAALQAGHLVHLVTLNEDGSPQVSVVWAGLEGDEILTGHIGAWQKVRNVRRDPRVVLSLEVPGDGPPAGGLVPYLVVHGTARVTEGGAADLLRQLEPVYLGPDGGALPLPDPAPPGFVLRITPTRLGGVGPWKGGG